MSATTHDAFRFVSPDGLFVDNPDLPPIVAGSPVVIGPEIRETPPLSLPGPILGEKRYSPHDRAGSPRPPSIDKLTRWGEVVPISGIANDKILLKRLVSGADWLLRNDTISISPLTPSKVISAGRRRRGFCNQ